MAIDTEHYKHLLQSKREDLMQEISTFHDDARNSQTSDVQDPIDYVVSSEAKALAFGGSNVASQMLEQTDAALQRIDAGDYGVCVDCGRDIPPKRLDAVPWTPYCVEDQEKHDRANPADNLALDSEPRS